MKLLAVMIVLGTTASAVALALSTPYNGATEVLCCCNTMNGQCCNWVSFCSGIVEGCVCQQ